MSKNKRPAGNANGYVSPPVPENGYSFVAAATLFRNYSGLAVYIKYKGGQKGVIKVKDAGQNHIWLVCPDREIVIVRNGFETHAFYPGADNFDEVHDFNLFNDAVCQHLGIEYVMTNYAHTTSGEQHPRLKSALPQHKRINVMSDSGGLQLARGVTQSIHPADLIDFYNKNTDAGMVLDVPLYLKDTKTLERAARLQRDNTNIMLDLSKGTELINIFHGSNIEERMRFREIVEDERVNRVAMSTLNRQTLLTAVNDIYHTVYGSKKRYKQYHALGIYIASYIPVLVKIANSGDNPPHITSDSTSHIQSARNLAYHFQFDITSTSKRLPIGLRASVPNTERIFPCQCGVCKALKYMDIMSFVPLRYVMELLSIHNAIEMTRYANQLQEACRQLPTREFNKLVRTQLKDNPELKQVNASLDFIDVAASEGIKAARRRYGSLLNVARSNTTGTNIPSLFGENTHDESIVKHEHAQRMLNQMEHAVKLWKKDGSRPEDKQVAAGSEEEQPKKSKKKKGKKKKVKSK